MTSHRNSPSPDWTIADRLGETGQRGHRASRPDLAPLIPPSGLIHRRERSSQRAPRRGTAPLDRDAARMRWMAVRAARGRHRSREIMLGHRKLCPHPPTVGAWLRRRGRRSPSRSAPPPSRRRAPRKSGRRCPIRCRCRSWTRPAPWRPTARRSGTRPSARAGLARAAAAWRPRQLRLVRATRSRRSSTSTR